MISALVATILLSPRDDVETGRVAGEGWMLYRGDRDTLDELEATFNRGGRVVMKFKGEADPKIEGTSYDDNDFRVDQINDIASTGSGTVNNILKTSAIVDLRCTYKGRPLQIRFKGKRVIR
jgi:hypothetical protein